MSDHLIMSTAKKSVRAKQGHIRLAGTRVPTLNPDLEIIRVGPLKNGRTVLQDKDGAKALVRRVGKAFAKSGLSKTVIFTPRTQGRVVFAYSVDPLDPSKIVRQSSDGKKRRGHLVRRKFTLA
jgi:hypothetical protein